MRADDMAGNFPAWSTEASGGGRKRRQTPRVVQGLKGPLGRGLHSFTFQLNLSSV